MKSSNFKSAYHFGGIVFIITVLIFSLIFGFIFKGCNSDNVINVNLNEAKVKTKDTIIVEKKIEKIVRDTIRIPVFPKPSFRPKVDTLSK